MHFFIIWILFKIMHNFIFFLSENFVSLKTKELFHPNKKIDRKEQNWIEYLWKLLFQTRGLGTI